MKVALLTHEHPLSPRPGGIGRYLRDYAPALAQEVDVTMITTEDGPELPGVRQIVVDGWQSLPSPVRTWVLAGEIAARLRQIQPDLVEAANFGGLGCRDNGPWAKVVRMATPVRHTPVRPSFMARLARPIHHRWEQATAERAELWISNSAANVETCKENYSCDKPTLVVPLGLKLQPAPVRPSRGDLLFVGRIEVRKGVDTLLHAWDRVVRQGLAEGTCLHLVGRDMAGRHTPSFLGECLEGLSFTEQTLKVHGGLSEAELSELRGRCSICVVPSRYESFGLVCVEAFAAGHCVVASAAGGLQEVVKDKIDGLLLPPESVEAWSTALAQLIRDNDLRQSLALAGSESLGRDFSVETMVKRSIEAYRQAIAIRASRGSS